MVHGCYRGPEDDGFWWLLSSCVYRRPLVAEEGKASNIWKSRENRAAPKALLPALGERLSQSGHWKEPDT